MFPFNFVFVIGRLFRVIKNMKLDLQSLRGPSNKKCVPWSELSDKVRTR